MNFRNIRLIALITALSCSVATCAPQKNLLQLAHSIVKGSQSGRKKARTKLLEALKHPDNVDVPTLSYIFTAFHYQKNTHLFEHYSGTVYEAIEHFTQTPGFLEKMHDLLLYANHPSFAKGHMYELEAALTREENGNRVIEFCHDFYCKRTRRIRSIDLVTNKHFIECKNINWGLHRTGIKAERIQNQLLSYKAFTQSPDNDKKRTLLLVSKQPISDQWKDWLEEHKIAYEERD
jgi:hypothetical protein